MKSKKIFVTTYGRYFANRIIGEGGSGIVYEVVDEDGIVKALKILKKENVNTEKRKRFKNEVAFCEKNQHKNVITILDRGVLVEGNEAIPFYVMPFYETSLRKIIEKGLTQEDILKYYSKILDGVEAAHLQKVWHRDLKPENILINTKEEDLVIADFGIASFIKEELLTIVETRADERLANFQYAAPEQRDRNKIVDHRADIYSLGLILNEMFTHEIPFGTRYKAIAKVSPRFAYLDNIVEKMLCRSPEERPQSIRELKGLIKSAEDNYISFQKISKIDATVIPQSQMDDPLIINPIQITDFEWDDGKLTLIFNQPVNRKWINALQNMGSHTSLIGYEPGKFVFDRGMDRVSIQAGRNVVQQLIDYFKTWISNTTAKYKQEILEEQERSENLEKDRIRKAREEEETKRHLRETIKL